MKRERSQFLFCYRAKYCAYCPDIAECGCSKPNEIYKLTGGIWATNAKTKFGQKPNS